MFQSPGRRGFRRRGHLGQCHDQLPPTAAVAVESAAGPSASCAGQPADAGAADLSVDLTSMEREIWD